MRIVQGTLATIAVMLIAAMSGCSKDARTAEDHSSADLSASRAEHDREGSEHGEEGPGEHAQGAEHGRTASGEHAEEEEESSAELALTERYDRVRNGARLILAYDAPSNSFIGTVENTTQKPLRRVRVEVHLSNGKELGPTTPVDLDPGEKSSVTLSAASRDFDGWTAHPEVGSGEHGGGRDGQSEGYDERLTRA